MNTIMNTKSSKAAEAAFRKIKDEAAVSEYSRQQKAVHEKIARLRALRFAQESADRVAAARAVTETAAAKKSAAKRRKTVSAKDAAVA